MFKKLALIMIAACVVGSNEVVAIDIRENKSPKQSQQNGVEPPLTSPTIRINTAGSGGSGVIIGRDKEIYSALTAYHVVKGMALSEVDIEISVSTQTKAISIEVPFKDIDLAVIQFRSNKSLPVAYMPSIDQQFWNAIDNWGYLKVEGFANATDSTATVTKRSSSGDILAIIKDNKDGYDFLHSAVTTVGVSGGGIYAQPLTNLYLSMSSIISENTKFEIIRDYRDFLTQRGSFDDNVAKRLASRDQSGFSEIERIYYKACINDQIKEGSSNPLFAYIAYRYKGGSGPRPDYKTHDCYMTARSLQSTLGVCALPAFSQDGDGLPRKPFEHNLLAIHGRSESYAYGGKSGAGLGIFLGSRRISDWLRANSRNLGIITKSGFYINCRHRIILPDTQIF